MQTKFTQYLLSLPDQASVTKAIRERRDRILNEIAEGFLKATDDVVSELAELNIALGDVPDVGGGDGN